jgi:hypothetical protein
LLLQCEYSIVTPSEAAYVAVDKPYPLPSAAAGYKIKAGAAAAAEEEEPNV